MVAQEKKLGLYLQNIPPNHAWTSALLDQISSVLPSNSQNIPSIADILRTLLGTRSRNTDRLMVDGCPGKKTRSPQTKGNLLPACQCALLDTYSSVVHMHYNSKHIPSIGDTIAILLGTCIGNMDRLIVGGDYRKKLELYLQSIMFKNACTCGLLDQNSLCPSVPHLP